MKRILLIAGAGFGILILVIAVLPFLIPSSVYKTQIEKAASKALGRDVTVEGDASISIFPVISASIENVSVANAEGFDEPAMITAGSLRGSVQLWPLFTRRVAVDEITFEDATVLLTRLEDGRVNWVLGNSDTAPAESEDAGGTSLNTSIDKARLRNAKLVYEDLQAGTRYELNELDAEASLKSPEKPLNLRADGLFQSERFELNLTLSSPQSLMDGSETSLDAQLGSNLGNLSFDGLLTTTEPVAVSGQFTANLPQLGEVSRFLQLDLPLNVEPLGGLKTSGTIEGQLPDLTIAFADLVLSGDGLNVNYDGTVSLTPSPALDGSGSIAIRDAYTLTQQLGLTMDILQPIRQVSVESNVQGPLDSLQLSGLDARTNGPNLSATYRGGLSLGDPGALGGNVNIESGQLRTLLSQLGVMLPEGDNLKTARLAGRLTGTLKKPTIENGTYVLDKAEAQGTLAADLQGTKPSIEANLALPLLDLSPFLGGKTDPSGSGNADSDWSDEPLDLEALKSVNAELKLKADKVVLNAITLSNADLGATLKDGQLTAALNRFTTFGGDWQGRGLVDVSGDIPRYNFKMSAQSVQAEKLLATLSGFDRLGGAGEFTVDIASDGSSIRQIVNALDGTVSLDLQNGVLKGVNLGQLVRSAGSLRESLQSGGLSIASLGTAVSPQAETDFSTFSTSLNIQDGLAQVQSLTLINPVVEVAGTGQINLGGRTLDLKLTPAIDKRGKGEAAAVQVNGIPVPLRIQGSWLSPKISPDLSGLQQALAAAARDEAAGQLKDKLGGDLGSIVSEAITKKKSPEPTTSASGGTTSNTGETVEATDDPAAVAEDDTADEEDTEEEVIKEVLGSIFGPKQ